MDKEQIRAILIDTLERTDPNRPEEVLEAMVESLSEEGMWTARVSAGYDPERICPKCNGPVEEEVEEGSECKKCYAIKRLIILKAILVKTYKNLDKSYRVFSRDTLASLVLDNPSLEQFTGRIKRAKDFLGSANGIPTPEFDVERALHTIDILESVVHSWQTIGRTFTNMGEAFNEAMDILARQFPAGTELGRCEQCPPESSPESSSEEDHPTTTGL